MGSKLLERLYSYEKATVGCEYNVTQFNIEKYYSMASMICGDDSSCDTDGDNHGCGCNA